MTIEKSDLTEEMWAEVLELKRLDYNCEQRERRRRQCFSKTNFKQWMEYRNTDKDNQDPWEKKRSRKSIHIQNPVQAEVERKERNDNLYRAIEQLLPEQQRLIRLKYGEEIKAVEIARCEGVSKSAISHRLERAYAQIKKSLL